MRKPRLDSRDAPLIIRSIQQHFSPEGGRNLNPIRKEIGKKKKRETDETPSRKGKNSGFPVRHSKEKTQPPRASSLIYSKKTKGVIERERLLSSGGGGSYVLQITYLNQETVVG